MAFASLKSPTAKALLLLLLCTSAVSAAPADRPATVVVHKAGAEKSAPTATSADADGDKPTVAASAEVPGPRATSADAPPAPANTADGRTAAAAPLNLTDSTDPSGIDYGRQIGIIAFFLTVTCLVAWLSVKLLSLKGTGMGRLGRSRQIRILERCMLMPQKGLFLIEVGNKTLLIGATDHSIATLAEMPSDTAAPTVEEGPVRAPEAGPFQFQQLLANLVSTRRNDG